VSFQLDRLQAVMNAEARSVCQSSRHDHITPRFYHLHCLRALQRIAYKLAYQSVMGISQIKSHIIKSNHKSFISKFALFKNV